MSFGEDDTPKGVAAAQQSARAAAVAAAALQPLTLTGGGGSGSSSSSAQPSSKPCFDYPLLPPPPPPTPLLRPEVGGPLGSGKSSWLQHPQKPLLQPLPDPWAAAGVSGSSVPKFAGAAVAPPMPPAPAPPPSFSPLSSNNPFQTALAAAVASTPGGSNPFVVESAQVGGA